MEYNENERLRKFNTLCNELDCMYHEIANNRGLSDSAYEILRAILVLGDGCTQTNIFKSSYINKQTVNTSINKLEKNGIVYFKKDNGKENKIYLTKKGKEFLEEKIIPIEKIENNIFADFSKAEYDTLIKVVSKYINEMKNKLDLVQNGDKL